MRRATPPLPPRAPQSAPALGASVSGQRPRPVLPHGAGEGKGREIKKYIYKKKKRKKKAFCCPPRPAARSVPGGCPARPRTAGMLPAPRRGGPDPRGRLRGGLPVPAPPAGPVPALHPPREPSPARGAPAPAAAAAPSPRCCGTGGAAGRCREGEEEGTEVPGDEGQQGREGGTHKVPVLPPSSSRRRARSADAEPEVLLLCAEI